MNAYLILLFLYVGLMSLLLTIKYLVEKLLGVKMD